MCVRVRPLVCVGCSHFRLSAATLLMFMVSSWCTTAYVAYSNQHMPDQDDPLALFDKIYDKPWTRLGPYLVGMGVGWVLFKTDCKIRMSKVRTAKQQLHKGGNWQRSSPLAFKYKSSLKKGPSQQQH